MRFRLVFAVFQLATLCVCQWSMVTQASAADATQIYVNRAKAIIEDPYCPEDAPASLLDARSFDQIRDRVQRLRALPTMDVSVPIVTHFRKVADYLQQIEPMFLETRERRRTEFWLGLLWTLQADDLGPGFRAYREIQQIERRFVDEMTEAAGRLRTDWIDTGREEILWPMLPTAAERLLAPFTVGPPRPFDPGPQAPLPASAAIYRSQTGQHEIPINLGEKRKVDIAHIQVDSFRRLSLDIPAPHPVIYQLTPTQPNRDFELSPAVIELAPFQSGNQWCMLPPGDYLLRAVSWRAAIDKPISLQLSAKWGESFHEFLNSRQLVGARGRRGGTQFPYYLKITVNEKNEVNGTLEWYTLGVTTRVEGKLETTTKGTVELRFQERALAKKLGAAPFPLGSVYVYSPEVVDGRFVLYGSATTGNQGNDTTFCMASGIEAGSDANPAVIASLGAVIKNLKLKGQAEQDRVKDPISVQLGLSQSKSSINASIYWPGQDLRQELAGAVIDTPSGLALCLVEQRVSKGGKRFYAKEVMIMSLLGKAYGDKVVFAGRWVRGSATGMIEVELPKTS